MTEFGWILPLLGYGLTLSLLPVVLLSKTRQPVSSVAWILAIVFVPIGGAVFFLLVGLHQPDRRKASRQRSIDELAARRLASPDDARPPSDGDRPEAQRLMRLVQRLVHAWPSSGNHVELLTDTNRTLGLIEQTLLHARESIHLEYYMWRPDRTGTRVRDLLIQRAREGVRVRFLYDAFGSFWLTQRFLRPMREAGIHVATFLPGQSLRERLSFNLRSHRKLVVVDGHIAFTGGMNIGDEYLGRTREAGFWRDAHLRIVGPEVAQHQRVFAEDWFYATDERLEYVAPFPARPTFGDVVAQTIASGPADDVSIVQSVMLEAIGEARDHLLLTTSYFVPPTAILAALENAAYRGVRVRLLLSGRRNLSWPLLAGRAAYDALLRAGVEIFEYQRGLMHAKTLTIDGHWSLVGSANVDCRSMFLNFEAGVALYDVAIAERLERQFDEDARDSKRIDPTMWAQRSRLHVVGENFCRLFTPVL